MDFFNRLQPLAQFLMRLVLGTFLIAHGYHKAWGGFHHPMESAAWLSSFVAAIELFGGIAIILGLFTRFFALVIVIDKVVAIWQVHPKGLMGLGGVEFPLTLATIALALLCYGGGPWGFNFGKGGGGSSKARRA